MTTPASQTDESSTFTMLVVDDDPETIRGEVATVEDYVRKKGWMPNTIIRETGRGIKAYLSSNTVDIVITDKNVDDKETGLKVVQAVEERGHLTDILFYSAVAYDTGEIRDKTDYGFVEFIQTRDFAQATKKLVDKNLRRSSDIAVLRGIFVSKVVELEVQVGEVVSQYFKMKDDEKKHFHSFILENRYYSLEGKIKTLSKALEDMGLEGNAKLKGLIADLKYLQEERNIIAHSRRDAVKRDCLIVMGEEESYDRRRVLRLFERAKLASEKLTNLQVLLKA